MNPAIDRRHFVTRSLVLAGAALLLPTQRLAASAPEVTLDDTADETQRRAFALVGQYGRVEQLQSNGPATRLTVRVRCFDAMNQALGRARDFGIGQVRAAGNQTSFEIDGRSFVVENQFG